MAIQLEHINLIIPIKQINLCYPGGFELFRTHHEDKFGDNFPTSANKEASETANA